MAFFSFLSGLNLGNFKVDGLSVTQKKQYILISYLHGKIHNLSDICYALQLDYMFMRLWYTLMGSFGIISTVQWRHLQGCLGNPRIWRDKL